MSFSNPLIIPVIPQHTQNWCWAASGQMIMNYLGSAGVSQCQEATDYPFVPPQTSPPTDWCASPPNIWGFTGWPQFSRYGFHSTQTSYGVAISWEQLKVEIDNNRPVAFVWAWQNGGGHMMVAVGYETLDGVNKVIINDPSPPNVGNRRSIPYTDFVKGTYLGEVYNHWCDFYGIVMQYPGAPGAGGNVSNSLSAAHAYLATVVKALGPGADPASASIGPGLAVKAIGLNQLKQLSAPGASSESVLDSTPVIAHQYAVMMHGSVASAIGTNMTPDGTWMASDVNTSWVRIFNEVRTKHSAASKIPVENYSVVAFNALNLYFLSYKQNNDMFLVPTQDNSTLSLIQGVAQPAKKVLDALIKVAVGHTGEPS